MTFKPEVGKQCSFYHSGGVGDRRWVIGWRVGTVRKIPTKGAKLGFVQIELPVARWSQDPVTRKWTPKPNDLVWVSASDMNELGDTLYHGPTVAEVLKERREKKAAEQAAADNKKAKARRFNR